MTSTLTAPPTIMDRLKSETRESHSATEAIPFSSAMMQRRLPRDRYVGQLAAYSIVHRALDEAAGSSSHPAVSAVWREDLAKSPLLDRDLAFFAHEALAIPEDALHAAKRFAAVIRSTAQEDPVSLLGSLYVLEGSTLGATILRTHVAAAYGLDAQAAGGLAYYSPYGNDAMPHWRSFRERMNAAVTDPGDQDRTVAAAQDAFRRIGQILAALSVDLRSASTT